MLEIAEVEDIFLFLHLGVAVPHALREIEQHIERPGPVAETCCRVIRRQEEVLLLELV